MSFVRGFAEVLANHIPSNKTLPFLIIVMSTLGTVIASYSIHANPEIDIPIAVFETSAIFLLIAFELSKCHIFTLKRSGSDKK